MKEAVKLFHEMPCKNICPNFVRYSLLIDSFCKEEKLDKARNLFYEMLNMNICSNVLTYRAISDGICKGNGREPPKCFMTCWIRGIVFGQLLDVIV